MARIGASIQVNGIVQGVGFRPFIHKQISDHALSGWIRNTSEGAELRIEGEEDAVRLFLSELETKKPVLAVIESIRAEFFTALQDYSGFTILPSLPGAERNTLISPDVCLCEDCRRELFDPRDRRFRYPFLNCTNCGPRFTIIRDIPYDRPMTSMAAFPMCESCEKEYRSITDRRYHAQPVCCPACGPVLLYYGKDGRLCRRGTGAEGPDGPLEAAKKLLREGGILAVKGLGGIHLACRMDDPSLAELLRRRKQRDQKPLALMCRSLEAAEKLCEIGPEEARLLTGFRRPIVLLKKKDPGAWRYISDNASIGIMLPYAPVHELLMEDGPDALIMTSANLSDRPILSGNEEALRGLSGIADGFLLNDREIAVRCDDSLLRVVNGKEYPLRRSRGYVPQPLSSERDLGRLLACGAEQKASFALSKGRYVFPCQHIGDLKNFETLENYEEQIRHFERLFDIRPQALVCDLHPDYLSSGYAEERAEAEGLPLLHVQHHYAHMVSCMADNGLEGEVMGLIWDGTGLGTDGTTWGGELLTGGAADFRRAAALLSFGLPGGDICTKELWRTGISLMERAELDPGLIFPEEQLRIADAPAALGLPVPVCTSMGRLFDGAAAILGICREAGYEGQGAILLEASAEPCEERYPYAFTEEDGLLRFDHRPMLRAMADDPDRSAHPGRAAARFMNTLTEAAVGLCLSVREKTGLDRVVLSGGCFQNMYLLQRLLRLLPAAGLTPFCHSRVSCNDEGLCLGQLTVAALHFSRNTNPR